MKILRLKLYTSRLQEQLIFYRDKLDLEVADQTDTMVSFRIGDSLLLFESKEGSNPYHFAINIPCNQISNALVWLKSEVDILKDGNHEIHNFESWNAEAIYFYDIDLNIVELIARKNLENASDISFGSSSFEEISEIALPTVDIQSLFDIINRSVGLPLYSGDLERFCAIGDEHGLFICIHKYKKRWFPTKEKAMTSDFAILIEAHDKKFEMEYKKGNLIIHTSQNN